LIPESHLPLNCYPESMTTVEILFRYAAPPSEQVAVALARARDVYGIRHLSFDRNARTLRVEYDATRLSAAEVAKLVREAGLEIAEEPPLIPPPAPQTTAPPAA
jgi:hypothetical protein